jgi:hypothetical protein
MRSNPFADRSRRNLRLLLVFLIVLELGLAAGLYVNSRNSSNSSATPWTIATPIKCAASQIHNDPRTVVQGHSETFSVCLPGLAGQMLRYTMTYADGTTESQSAQADGNGFSSRAFTISHHPQAGREAVVVSVSYRGVVKQRTQFAIQEPGFK